jgi:hypothetical protein
MKSNQRKQMFNPEENPIPGINFYLGVANRIGFKILWPHHFMFAAYWNLHKRQFGWFFVPYQESPDWARI